MNEMITYMSSANANTRLDNIVCTENCSSEGKANGCSDSTCTCACFDDVVSGTYNSYSTRNYNIVCTDAGISDWRVSTNWSCTIRDERADNPWWDFWSSDY